MEQLVLHAEAWMHLKSILLSEGSQTPKTAYHDVIPLNENLKGQDYNHVN